MPDTVGFGGNLGVLDQRCGAFGTVFIFKKISSEWSIFPENLHTISENFKPFLTNLNNL